jgi:hypothetical protein
MRVGRIGQEAHAAVPPRPRNPSNMIAARVESYTHAAKVWALCVVQGPFSVAPRANRYKSVSAHLRWLVAGLYVGLTASLLQLATATSATKPAGSSSDWQPVVSASARAEAGVAAVTLQEINVLELSADGVCLAVGVRQVGACTGGR